MIASERRLENSSGFYIRTPMVSALHDRLVQWTACGMTGGLIVGASRSGKSVAIRALEDSIRSRSGETIWLFRVTLGDRDQRTLRGVHGKVARTLGFHVRKSHTADDLVEESCKRLEEASLSNDARQVILVIDEAQLLTLEQMGAFAEIYNVLFEAHVNCVVFFVANQDQFAPRARELLWKENTYLRERFFANHYIFYGIRTRNELAQCLRAYDAYYVDNCNSITATQYYCAALYEQEWRLEDLALLYWQLYEERFMHPLNEIALRMSHFTRATNILLMDYLGQLDMIPKEATLTAMILRSLEAANIESSLAQLAS